MLGYWQLTVGQAPSRRRWGELNRQIARPAQLRVFHYHPQLVDDLTQHFRRPGRLQTFPDGSAAFRRRFCPGLSYHPAPPLP